MQVEIFADARRFLARARPVIDANPAECNVIATLAGYAASTASTRSSGDDRYLLVHDDGHPVGIAKLSCEHGLVLGSLGPEPTTGTAALVDMLSGQSFPNVNGPAEAAYAMAAAWAARTGRQWVLLREDVLYAIDAAPTAPAVAGSVREQRPADRPSLGRWFTEFQAEVHPHRSRPGPDSSSKASGLKHRPSARAGADRTILLWLDPDGLPVSMAGVTPAHAGMSRIGPVFTPRPFRGHGYASALTAAGTRLAFERGAQRVMLYADKANATSNGIYRRLGYLPIGDAVLISFT